jgi:hypothetical protein
MKTSLFIFIGFALLVSQPLVGQDRVSRDDALADLRYLFALIEEVHPDPYSAFGGKVAFKREAQELWLGIPEQGMTSDELYDLVRPFFGQMMDGHSHIQRPSSTAAVADRRYLPVRFRIAVDAIFVSSARQTYGDLIGYRVEAVQGKSLDELRQAAQSVFPAENEFGATRRFTSLLSSNSAARYLLDDTPDRLTLSLIAENGAEVTRVIPYELTRDQWLDGEWEVRRWEAIEERDAPFYFQVWPDRDAAYFKVRTIMSREAFEIMRAAGRTDLDQWLGQFYSRYLDRPLPEDTDVAIAGVPSFSETAFNLLEESKTHQTRRLIIDLRGNGGGWSDILKPFYYMLHGDRYFEASLPVVFATQISRPHLELGDVSLGAQYEIGDYLFSEAPPNPAPEDARELFLDELRASRQSSLQYVESLRGEALYTPEVYVVIDPGTFSAAYHLAYYLWRLGAKIVGVPSAQAGNAFVDPIPFELPNTGLEGAISRTAQILFPDDAERGRVLMPDFPLNWADFRAYGFDAHAEIRYLLERTE